MAQFCFLIVSQLRQNQPFGVQNAIARRRRVDSPVSRPLSYRSHPLPVQWLSLRAPYSLYCGCTTKIRIAAQRHHIRRTPLSQAHLPVPRASLLCLLTASLLHGTEVRVRCPSGQLCETRGINWHRGNGGVWTFCLLWPDASVVESTLPLFPRPMSRLLGSECVGHLLVR